MGVVAVYPRQLLEAELVVLGSGVTPPGLEQRDHVGLQVPPRPGVRPVELDEPVQGGVGLRVGHRDVPGQDVVQRRYVSGALDVGVAAQGQNPAPWRPMLPSRSWMIEAARMFCTPIVCWVQPTEYTIAEVRSGPSSHTAPEPRESRREASSHRSPRRPRGCSGRSGAGGSEEHSARPASSCRCPADRRLRAPCRGRRGTARRRRRPAALICPPWPRYWIRCAPRCRVGRRRRPDSSPRRVRWCLARRPGTPLMITGPLVKWRT